jgi:hypothetical protein
VAGNSDDAGGGSGCGVTVVGAEPATCAGSTARAAGARAAGGTGTTEAAGAGAACTGVASCGFMTVRYRKPSPFSKTNTIVIASVLIQIPTWSL